MSTRMVKLIGFKGDVYAQNMNVPTKGIGNKVPPIVAVCNDIFEWDSKAGVYQQIQPHRIHIPYRPLNVSGW
jgi:hypothetical protein